MTAFSHRALLALAITTLAAFPARADDSEAFFKGRTVTITNPFGEAGLYGGLVRLAAERLSHHLPGHPTGIPQFMPGAGGLKQANHLYNVAPKDGSVIGLMYDNTPTAQVTQGGRGVKYDARRFRAIGSVNKGEFALLATLKTSGIATVADAKAKEAVLGSTGIGSAQYIVPMVINKLLSTRFKLVPGYKSTADLWLAMEREELTGVFTNYNTIFEARPHWITGKKLNWLAQLSDQRSPDFADVPLLQELTADPSEKAVFTFLALSRIPGKIFITPPDVPEPRLAALRAAFSATMRDPAFIEGAKKLSLAVDPRSWQDCERLIRETVETRPEVLARVNELTTVKQP